MGCCLRVIDIIDWVRVAVLPREPVAAGRVVGANLTLGAPTGSDTWEQFLTDPTAGA